MPGEVQSASWLKAALTGASKRLPESWDLRLHLALVYIRAGQYDRAVTELQEARQICAKCSAPDAVRITLLTHLAAAQSLRLREDPEEALASLEEALKLDGQNPGTWMTMALVFILSRSWDAACAALSVAWLRNGSEGLNNLGVVSVGQGNLSEAQRYFHNALQINRAQAEAANNYAVTLLHQGEAEAAVQVLERVCEQEESAHVWANLGCAYRAIGALDRSREACHQALKACLSSEAVRFGVARQFLRDGNLKEALTTLADLVRIRPAPHYHLTVSMVLFAKQQTALHSVLDNDTEEGLAAQVQHSAEALRHCGETRNATSQLSLQALMTGDYGRAVQVLASHSALHTPHATSALVWCNLASALHMNEQWDLADEAYQRALPLCRPAQCAVVHNNLGVLRRQRCKWHEAEEALKEAIREAPHWAAPHVNLGLLYVAKAAKNYQVAAVAEWQEALRLDPTCAAAQHNLARLKTITAPVKGQS